MFSICFSLSLVFNPPLDHYQLLVVYSGRPDMRHNGRLLMHYGFVVPGNPYDSVSIEVNITLCIILISPYMLKHSFL